MIIITATYREYPCDAESIQVLTLTSPWSLFPCSLFPRALAWCCSWTWEAGSYLRTFVLAVPDPWDALPLSVLRAPSLTSFRSLMKYHLLSNTAPTHPLSFLIFFHLPLLTYMFLRPFGSSHLTLVYELLGTGTWFCHHFFPRAYCWLDRHRHAEDLCGVNNSGVGTWESPSPTSVNRPR